MNVKYHAKDMQEALSKIKKELGSDAIIVSSKQVRSKGGILGMFSPKVYEVIAEYDPVQNRKEQDRKLSFEKKRPSFTMPATDKATKTAPKVFSAPSSFQSEPLNKRSIVTFGDMSASPSVRPIKSDKIDNAVKQVQLAEYKQDKKAIAELDNKIDQLSDIIQNFSTKFEYLKKDVAYDYSPQVENILMNLIENDVDEEYAHDICSRVQELMGRKDVTHLEALDHLLREIIGEISYIEPNKFERKVVMIVGPTGVGKTTTLVKLASYFVVKQELKVGIINTDVYRVAAQEQLKTFAKILNVPMATVYKPSEIKAALKEFEDMDIVFVDTAGKVSTDTEYQEDLKGYIAEGNIDEIYLALCGSSSNKILRETINNYAFLKKHNIIVTKMDEGISNGALINIKMMSGRPLSYVTVGQSVPDDIQKVDVSAIISDMVRY
ncbi:MAG: flagellar biosynthesis protein FlhF [Lachnospiraceae bacterium]|nr:flagellar biosynthesis protein FlhF [Lachnospiraceae bacterium]